MYKKIEFTVGSTTYGVQYKPKVKSFEYTKRLGSKVIEIDVNEFKEAKALWIRNQAAKGINVDTSHWGRTLGYY